ncbi:MAG: alpha/beta hydrolase [Planctomycetes bacterium]|nr:alpha/beta hydrolase [Planctomycetota bacterium]
MCFVDRSGKAIRQAVAASCLAILFATIFSIRTSQAIETEGVHRQQTNVVYNEVHGVGLLMDIFTPTGKRNGHAIVDVISGAWYSDRGKLRDHQRADIFNIFCDHGYTVFAIRPGSVTKFTVSEMVSNVEQGIQWVKQHASDYKIAPNQLGLVGASAGGHLASLVAVANGRSTPESSQDSASVMAAGVFFPPTDFLNYGGREIDPKNDPGFGAILKRLAFRDGFEGLSDDQIRDRIVAISPARLVTENTPPFLLFHGTADALVPIQQSRTMLAALQEKDVSAQLIVKLRGGHPWPTIHEEVETLANWFDEQLGVTTVNDAVNKITIDGNMKDWRSVASYTDPVGDTHDTDHIERDDTPRLVNHPDVDLLEYKVAHDADNLYVYLRSKGVIANTQRSADGQAGRYYVIVTIDVDNDDKTGYWIGEGGYYPTTRGYDVNAEVEFYDGELNTACYLNHGALDQKELAQAFLDQSLEKYRAGHDGPYPAGFMRVLPGTYDHYTQWVYHADDTITFVRDKGPVVRGIANAVVSSDGHQIEAKFPFKGFLLDEHGKPVLQLGTKVDISFSLEASGELAPDGAWASDTGEPINGYYLTPILQ